MEVADLPSDPELGQTELEELYHIKNGVEAGHGCWKAKPVCIPSNFPHYREGAEVAVGKFL